MDTTTVKATDRILKGTSTLVYGSDLGVRLYESSDPITLLGKRITDEPAFGGMSVLVGSTPGIVQPSENPNYVVIPATSAADSSFLLASMAPDHTLYAASEGVLDEETIRRRREISLALDARVSAQPRINFFVRDQENLEGSMINILESGRAHVDRMSLATLGPRYQNYLDGVREELRREYPDIS